MPRREGVEHELAMLVGTAVAVDDPRTVVVAMRIPAHSDAQAAPGAEEDRTRPLRKRMSRVFRPDVSGC